MRGREEVTGQRQLRNEELHGCTAHKILLGTSVSWTNHIKGKAITVQDYFRDRSFQELEAP
jgi:hypothetical protein